MLHPFYLIMLLVHITITSELRKWQQKRKHFTLKWRTSILAEVRNSTQRCADESDYDIKVPGERFKSIRSSLSNIYRATSMSYVNRFVQQYTRNSRLIYGFRRDFYISDGLARNSLVLVRFSKTHLSCLLFYYYDRILILVTRLIIEVCCYRSFLSSPHNHCPSL